MPAKTILVTGGAGCIGSNFVRFALENGYKVINLDALTYAGSRSSLVSLDDPKTHLFVEGRITDEALLGRLMAEHRPDAVVNFAAETHVDRSIDHPETFVQTNVLGVVVLLEAVRSYIAGEGSPQRDTFRFVHVSTDEVYGDIDKDAATESSPYAPSSPYAASKASADHFVRAWQRTYGLAAIITNCSNNYGPFQFPEKLIPLMVTKAVREEPLPVYGKGDQVRDWLHVSDHCRALEMVLTRGRPGQTYNVASGTGYPNLEVVRRLCGILDDFKPRDGGASYGDLIEHVEDRPGHDVRYAIDASKLRTELGWSPEVAFDEGLRQTVRWYLDNPDWIANVLSRYDGRRLGRIRQER